MRNRKLKKVLLISLSTIAILFVVLCIHIYVMMNARHISDKTVAMARIDFKQDINQTDADKISTWLYAQQGVQHVLCNEKSNIVVFSFYPTKVNATNVVNDLSNQLHYNAVRYMPSEKELAQSCPVMAESFSNKVYTVMNKIF